MLNGFRTGLTFQAIPRKRSGIKLVELAQIAVPDEAVTQPS